jgi:hypothetical protein
MLPSQPRPPHPPPGPRSPSPSPLASPITPATGTFRAKRLRQEPVPEALNKGDIALKAKDETIKLQAEMIAYLKGQVLKLEAMQESLLKKFVLN